MKSRLPAAAEAPARSPAAAGPAPAGETSNADRVQEMAAAGLDGGGGALPHEGVLSEALGVDMSGVAAHTDGAAADAVNALGAGAYTQGGEIAFDGQPTLHEAAHEAAHVVQAGEGVGPTGAGAAGDPFERHADAVADAVVAGEPAADVLGAMPAGGGGGGVQAYAGDMNTQLDPSLGGTGQSVEAARDARFGPNVERDSMENNALKVQFEGELAASLLKEDAFYRPVVATVSKNILTYLETKSKLFGTGDIQGDVDKELSKLKGMYGGTKDWEKDLYFGRICDSIAEMANASGPMGKLRDVLAGAGSIPNQMYAHHQFLDEVYFKDYYGPAGDAKLAAQGMVEAQTGQVAKILEEMNKSRAADAQLEAVEPKALRAPTESDNTANGGSVVTNPFGMQVDAQGEAVHVGPTKKGLAGEVQGEETGLGTLNELGSSGVGGRHMRGRSTNTDPTKGYVAPQMVGRTVAPRVNTVVGIGDEGPLGVAGDDGGGQMHGRGVDTYTLDESQLFVQQARAELDMPLAAGVSGTTTDLFEIAMTMGVTAPDDLFKYALGCLAQLMGAGAHSFHEIMTAANSAGVPLYTPGDYRSIRDRLGGHPASALFDKPEYANVPGIGTAPVAGGAATPAGPAAAPAAPAAPVS